MISDKMKKLIKSNSVIREMFEEGSRLKSIYGEDNVFDFRILATTTGNANLPYEVTARKKMDSDAIDNYVKLYLT